MAGGSDLTGDGRPEVVVAVTGACGTSVLILDLARPLLPPPGTGDDTLAGTAGRDEHFGGPGDDALGGGAGRDCLHGDPGNDRLLGGSGTDVLRGAAGADVLLGVSGVDDLAGGAGDDRLAGGANTGQRNPAALHPAKEALAGGAGDDRLDGGAGRDDLRAKLETTGCRAGRAGTSSTAVAARTGSRAARDDILSAAGVGSQGPAWRDHDVLIAGAGDDRIFVDSGGRTRIMAGPGDDRIEARDGRVDRIDCGSGRDRVIADRSDRLRGCERRVTRGST